MLLLEDTQVSWNRIILFQKTCIFMRSAKSFITD